MFERASISQRRASWSTNDDGIEAPGIKLLAQDRARASAATSGWSRRSSEQSGASHSLTLDRPLRVRKLGARRFAVDGTPTDCVLLAVKRCSATSGRPGALGRQCRRQSRRGRDLFRHRRRGDGSDAARACRRSPSASTTPTARKIHWATAGAHAPAVIRRLAALPWPRNTLINVNFPDVPPDAGHRHRRRRAQGRRKIGDGRGRARRPARPALLSGSDRCATNGRTRPAPISTRSSTARCRVTPIYLDLTNAPGAGRARARCSREPTHARPRRAAPADGAARAPASPTRACWGRSSGCRASSSCRPPSRTRPTRMWRCRSATARPSASRWSWR